MTSCRRMRSWLIGSILCSWLAPLAASAQNVLLVRHEGKLAIVEAMNGAHARVRNAGTQQLENADSHGFLLKDAGKFRPLFIAVRDLALASARVQTGDGAKPGFELTCTASIEAGVSLENVFLVLAIPRKSDGKTQYVVRDLGALRANTPSAVEFRVPSARPLNFKHARIHLFTHGWEVFHSELPREEMESWLDGEIARLVGTMSEAPLQPYLTVPPEYPSALRGEGRTGTARVKAVVTVEGRVTGPVVLSASEPEFGTAAAASLQRWRFVPRVDEGRAVAQTVVIPMEFVAPAE